MKEDIATAKEGLDKSIWTCYHGLMGSGLHAKSKQSNKYGESTCLLQH
jgi:hypothetical protein